MIFRTAATTAVLAVGLAVVGAVTGPQWDPVPVEDHLTPSTSDTAIGGLEPGDVEPVGTYEVRETPVQIPLDGTTVDGILREPVGAPGERSGVVFVHGAGTGRATVAFTDLATDLTSAGVVTLVPDKRLDTYTTLERDYVAMAQDYLRSVDLLRTVPGVDPDDVGVYGESEGTWIVPVMMVDDPRLAFSVLVSAPVVAPREQAAYAVDNYLRNTGVPQDVFRAIPRAVGMQLPGALEYADFDVRPYLEQQDDPILVVYGTADPSMPVEQGARVVVADAATNGNHDVTVRYYAGANHGIRVDGQLHPDFVRDLSDWVQGLPATAGAPPTVAGDEPSQLYLAEPVPTPRWFGNVDVVVVVVVGALVLLVAGPLVWVGAAVVRRVRRHRLAGPDVRVGSMARGLRRALAAGAVGAVVTVVALVVYLVAVARLALDYERNAWVVQGGWITVRVLGLAAVVALAVVVNRVTDLRAARRALRVQARAAAAGTGTAGGAGAGTGGGDVVADAAGPSALHRAVHGWPAHVTFWTVLTGTVVLLVVLAYWGVFQLGI